MFARVITARAGPQGSGTGIRAAREQLPGARQQPGFKGFYLLIDAETGKIITILLRENQEQTEAAGARAAGIRDQAMPATGLTSPHRETCEVTMHA